jgi:hypothetical protein
MTSPDATIAVAAANDAAASDESGAGGNGGSDGGGPAAPARRPGPREREILLLCVAGIIVYLVLAYLVFVRPGVSRVDHVLAVFLSVGALGLAADLWPRMPAGLRASLALVAGALAVVTGVVAVARARVESLVAVGLLGVLPLVGGAVLIGLGVWLLWTSRRRGGRLWWTVVRRALLVVAALLLAYWVVIPASMAIVATELPRRPVEAVDLGRPCEDVTLTTRDGLDLSAWYVPSLNHGAVITFPRAWTAERARMLVENGYGVLMVATT